MMVFALSVIAFLLQPEEADLPDVPASSEIGTWALIFIFGAIAAIVAFEVLRTWRQTNQWRRHLPRHRE
jgi:hypothetical protein